MLYKEFLAWHTNGCSTALLCDFMNNSIVQELIKEADYFGDNSDERLYIGLRQRNGYTKELEKPKRNDSKMTITIETKECFTKKMS